MNYINYVEIARNLYGLINPNYAQNRRLERFDRLVSSGKLEGMCSSEVHKLLGIKKNSSEF